MELAMGAMGPLLSKLSELLQDEYVAQRGLKREIESLAGELEMMYAVLDEVSRVPPDKLSKPDKLWAGKVRELSYDMEDAVDAFIVRVAARQQEGPDDASIFQRLTHKAAKLITKVKDRHQLSDKIEEIKNLSKQLGELRLKYSFSGAAPPREDPGVDPRVINLYKYKGELVGIEEAREELIRKLSYPEGQESRKIVSIVGPGGLGKTTIAKVVYDELKTTKSFDCSAFVSVGRNSLVTSTLRELLEQLSNNKYSSSDMTSWKAERFIGVLLEFLQGKRYIIVVDDVWEKNTWNTINCAFPYSNCGSRVIITTRNSEVHAEANDIYKLKPLSPIKSKELFYRRTSGRNEDNQLAEVIDNIIGKCGGIPLAIIAIASLLADRPLEDWEKVYNSIIFGHKDNTRTILLYSYYDLPSYLKPCLLYLSMYPEDYLIRKSTLIRRWIAEGFVQLPKEGGSLFEVGERYFSELSNRSMIQPKEENVGGIIHGCRVHDIVLDLIRDLSEEENFVTILGEKQCAIPDSTTLRGSERKVRRLSVQMCRTERIPQDTIGTPEVVRSLNIISSKIEVMPLLSSFQACRVLVIKNLIYTEVLKHLGKLLHLRYLEVNDLPGKQLPKEIGNLKYLQTLIVDGAIDALPPTICELKQLKCLYVGIFTAVPTDRIGNLVCLEELILCVNKADDFVVELGKLTRLRVLDISYLGVRLNETSYKDLVQSLSNLKEIRELRLHGFWGMRKPVTVLEGWEPPRQLWCLDIFRMGFSTRWLMNPSRFPCIRYLVLDMEVEEPKDLENLAQLPGLINLHLRGLPQLPVHVIGAEGFKNLKVYRTEGAFKFLHGAVPRLESLRFCFFISYQTNHDYNEEQFPTRYGLPNLDFGLGNLLSLKEIIVEVDCKYSFVADVEEAEDMVRCAVEDHRNRPTLRMSRCGDMYMLSDDKVKPDKVVHLLLSVRDRKDPGDPKYYHVLNLRCYRWLEKVTCDIDCKGARLSEVEETESALRLAATVHRRRPILVINRTNEDKMTSASDHCNSEPGDRDDRVYTNRWRYRHNDFEQYMTIDTSSNPSCVAGLP